MRIALAADHAGFEMKRDLAAALATSGHEVLDLGTHSTAAVDYPDCAESVAEALRDGHAERGIIVCGSGAGVSIAANKFPGIRAAVCHDTYTAHQAVEHDDMNVLCVGARVIGFALAQEIATTFLAARFSGEERHTRRLNKILAIESRFVRA
ncbi:MAG: ribose 5-phosphate isomerase B [Acidimicrobiia bacterium]|nr:ribose 5-phosphate isomerase B [Acidimicrobiia bacterium]